MLNKIIVLLLMIFIFSSSSFAGEGKPLDISAYKGKVVMVDFWASWCVPCRKSFPWLNKMHTTKTPQGFVILGVNVDENSEDAKNFLLQNTSNFKHIYDPDGQYASYYKLIGMPSTLIFDRQGKLQHQHTGFKMNKINEYEQIINRILAIK